MVMGKDQPVKEICGESKVRVEKLEVGVKEWARATTLASTSAASQEGVEPAWATEVAELVTEGVVAEKEAGASNWIPLLRGRKTRDFRHTSPDRLDHTDLSPTITN